MDELITDLQEELRCCRAEIVDLRSRLNRTIHDLMQSKASLVGARYELEKAREQLSLKNG